MPSYEYKCPDDHVTEDLRKMDERQDPGPSCAECGKATVFVVSAGKRQNFRLKAAWANRNTNFTEI